MKLGAFQKIILIFAIIMLVIILLFIATSLAAAKMTATWPPVTPVCPDWWISDGSGNNSRCINSKKLGVCDENEKNFNTAQFTGSNGLCNKYRWATGCKVSWDGITYGVPDPCST